MTPTAASRRPWLRLAARLVASIPLGSLTTLAVAWGVAYRGIDRLPMFPRQASAYVLPDAHSTLLFSEPQRGVAWSVCYTQHRTASMVYSDQVWYERREGLQLGEPRCPRLAAMPSDAHPPDGSADTRQEFRFGWPSCAMWASNNLDYSGCNTVFLGTSHVVSRGPPPGRWTTPFVRAQSDTVPPTRCFPTGILPRGFALNTGFYAGSWLLLLSLPAALRRTLRRRLAQCESCGYPRAGLTPSAACPECGLPTPRAGSAPPNP